MRVASVLLLALLGVASPSVAQRPAVPPVDTVSVVALHLSDGSDVVGRVVAADDSSLTLLTFAGARVTVPRRSILSWREQAGRVTAEGFRLSDPNAHRLFFGPTARTLPKGRGAFADYYIFFPAAGVGVSDRVMLSGGVSLVPGASSQLIYMAAKVGLVRRQDAAFALGAFWATVPDQPDSWLGVGYAVTTLGTEDRAVTLMAGMPFTTAEVTKEPLFIVGGENRIGKDAKLMAEVWKLPGVTEVPALAGVRWFSDKLAVGFGFIYVFPNGVEGWPLIPWVDFTVNW